MVHLECTKMHPLLKCNFLRNVVAPLRGCEWGICLALAANRPMANQPPSCHKFEQLHRERYDQINPTKRDFFQLTKCRFSRQPATPSDSQFKSTIWTETPVLKEVL